MPLLMQLPLDGSAAAAAVVDAVVDVPPNASFDENDCA